MNRREFSGMFMGTALAHRLCRGTAWAELLPEAVPVKFSVMLWVLGKGMAMEQRLQIVADAGYQGGELVGEWRAWSAEERKRIVAKKNALGLTFDLMFPSTVALTDPAAPAKLTDEIRQAIPIAQEIGCTTFSFRSGPRVDGQSPEVQRATIVSNLKVAADLCSAAKMDLLLEPIDLLEAKREAVNTVTEGFEITRSVGNPNLRVLYDFYHEQRGAGNLIEKLEKNIDQVGLVHIADVPGRHRPGTGEMDYGNIYRELARLHYSRYICMEFYPIGDPVAELKAARLEAVAAMQSA